MGRRAKGVLALLALVGTAFLLSLFSAGRQRPGEVATAPPTCPGCNLILVSFEELDSGELYAYGGTQNMTPHLDRFANHAAVFTKASSDAKKDPAQDPAVNPAELLKTRGYSTTAILGQAKEFVWAGREQGFQRFEALPDETPMSTMQRAITLLPELPRPLFLWIHLLQARPSTPETDPLSAGPGATPPLAQTDHAFGQLLYVMDAAEMWKQSMVAVTSTGGPSGLPLLVRLPVGLHAVYDHPVSIPELLPSILETLGVQVPPAAKRKNIFRPETPSQPTKE